MSALRALDRPIALALRVAAVLAFLPPLFTRLLFGHAFYLTGSGKIANPPVEFFANLGIPMPGANAVFVAYVEYIGGILLVLGLFTRIAALFLSSTMVVALLTAHREELRMALHGLGDGVPTDIVPLVWLASLLWLLVYGPGPISLDALLVRKLHLGGTKPAPQA
jgi:putative oxidoreductase